MEDAVLPATVCVRFCRASSGAPTRSTTIAGLPSLQLFSPPKNTSIKWALNSLIRGHVQIFLCGHRLNDASLTEARYNSAAANLRSVCEEFEEIIVAFRHSSVVKTSAHHAFVTDRLAAILQKRVRSYPPKAAGGTVTSIPLTTVSRVGTFDAWVSLQFGDAEHSASASLIVNSGAHTPVR